MIHMSLDEYLADIDRQEKEKLEAIRNSGCLIEKLDPDFIYVTAYLINGKVHTSDEKGIGEIMPSFYMYELAISLLKHNMGIDLSGTYSFGTVCDNVITIIRYLYTRRFNRKVSIFNSSFNYIKYHNTTMDNIPQLFEIPKLVRTMNDKCALIGVDEVYAGFDDVVLCDCSSFDRIGVGVNTIIMLDANKNVYDMQSFIDNNIDILNSKRVKYIDLNTKSMALYGVEYDFKRRQKLNGKTFNDNMFFYT